MNKRQLLPISMLFCLTVLCVEATSVEASSLGHIKPLKTPQNPLIEPSPPTLSSKAYLLIDTNSGKILVEKNSDKQLPPASLTKMMTLYVISHALKSGQIHLEDTVHISKKAWKTGGSRMFIREGQKVKVEDLLKGIIVDSGNDACVAMAEYIAGDEKTFADIMNQQAKTLGMTHSHFTDSTGLPNPKLYTTARDLAILGTALIKEFPQYYHWYKQKWFTFNGIKQPNRNRLLWRMPSVDGIKTGHTNAAGFCLVASAKEKNSRLLSVVLGAGTDSIRADNSQRLLNFGFHFYETHKLYNANESISSLKLWKGKKAQVKAGLKKPLYVTIYKGQFKQLDVAMKVIKNLEAPIVKGQNLGEVIVSLNDKVISKKPLIALEGVKEAGQFKRFTDSIKMKFS